MELKKINLKINKTKTLILIAIITLLVFVSGITYAYFQTQGNNGANANVNVLSSSTDNLIFTVEKDIYINASVANFGEGMGDLSDDTNATATLIPNNYDNTASAMYNIYIIIESNNLEYTTPNNTPELLLNVTDPNGNKLENITGLVHYEQGFDITTRTGGFLIASDYVIEANNATEVQNWNIEITLANLDSNQNANTGKNFSAKIYMTQEKMSSYNPVQITNIEATPTYNTIDTNLVLSNGSADVDKYYFGIEEANNQTAYINDNQVIRLSNLASADTVTYYESETPNYEFSNLKDNTEYIIYSYAIDVNNVKSNVYETRVTTNEYALATISEVTHSVTLNSITLTVTANSGDGTITKYMYSNNDGESWIESDSNTYTFTNLSDTTEYKIRVKVVDSNGVESTEYYEAIATETYILPVVANVEYTTTYNSITLTPSGTDGTNTIDHYLYAIDNGEYQTSNVFSNLNEQTEYTINVKAIDNNNRESNPYTIQVTTDTYEIPEITNVSTSSTEDSITINVSATNGDGTITRYLYSRDNGSNWYESTSNSYTFNNLTSNTTFYIQVKVIDNNNRESAVYNTTETTLYIDPVVNSVSTSNVTSSSITLTVNATAGTNAIQTYYYSSNNGSSYVSSNSNTYTFSGLSGSTTYNFRVYVVDNEGVQSNYGTTSATTTYANPVVNSVSAGSITESSIRLTINATAGSSSIATYYYSNNNGASYVSSTSNTYRFSGLSAGTTYNFRVYVVDSNGNKSNESTVRATTSYEDPEVSSVTITNIESNSITVSVTASGGSNSVSRYYYSINNGSYTSSTSNSYTFSDLNSNTTYSIRVYVTDTKGEPSNIYTISATTEESVLLADYIKSLYTSQGSNGIYYHTSSLSNSAGDNSYRYAGANPNNYVCFGTNSTSCSSSNLYRIIGVFGSQVKLIKSTSYGSYYWSNSTTSNTWSGSNVQGIINGSFLSGLGSTWSSKIATTNWNVSGVSSISASAKTVYSNEITNSSTTHRAKVGLMYLSDYAYAATSGYWNTNLSSYSSAANSNWLYLGPTEWTITRSSVNSSTSAYGINSSGSAVSSIADSNSKAIRPSFYLNSSVTYVSGTGTSSDPIILSV